MTNQPCFSQQDRPSARSTNPSAGRTSGAPSHAIWAFEKSDARIERQWSNTVLPADLHDRVRDCQTQLQQNLTLTDSNIQTQQRIAITTTEPQHCLLWTIAAHDLGHDVFLCDPHWSPKEFAAVTAQIDPIAIVGGETGRELMPRSRTPKPSLTAPSDRHPYIAIPTGGTSGRMRFACHTWQTLAASAIGARDAFQRDRIDSFCCLPTLHVSGFAQFVRAAVTGGRLAIAPPRTIQHDRQPPTGCFSGFWLSLVPTQLQRLIDRVDWRNWLRQFDAILLGGAPAWPELLDRARAENLRLAPTFGMTETASQIATLHPDDFLAGQTGCGCVLPHAEISIDADINADAAPNADRPIDRSGPIAIRARSLFHGYYDPTTGSAAPLTKGRAWHGDDLGYFDRDGSLHVTGRASQKAIVGGENVYPDAVETAIRATGCVSDVTVLSLPDREWGQVLAAVYVPSSDRHDADACVRAIRDRLQQDLARYKIPKRWRAVNILPRNDRGKLNRTRLRELFED